MLGPKNVPFFKDPVQGIKIGVSDLKKALDFWKTDLQMTCKSESASSAVLSYGDDGPTLELEVVGKVDRGTAFGRIAFSIPFDQQPPLQDRLKAKGRTILNTLVELGTPGKATVRVIIIADPVITFLGKFTNFF